MGVKGLRAKGTRPNEKSKCKFSFVKSDSKSVRLIWSAEKSNVEQTIIKIGQSRLSMQAVPPASSIL